MMPTMTPTIRLVSALAFALAPLALGALTAAPAAAQPVMAPEALPPRVGFEGGFGLYGGEINCDDQVGNRCDGVTEAGGVAGHLTYMFAPEIGITFDAWPMVHREDNFTFTHTVVTLGATWRPVPILGLGVGLGSAHATAHWDGLIDVTSRTEDAPAVLFSAGLDVVRGRSFALAIEARAGLGFYGDDQDGDGNPDIVGRNLGLGAALTWF